jgi:hypothetical protein
MRLSLLAALLAVKERSSGSKILSPLTVRTLSSRYPQKPSSSFKKRFVTGEDLRRFGLTPGKDFALWLDRAGRHQWRGVHTTRTEALSWLKKSLKKK